MKWEVRKIYLDYLRRRLVMVGVIVLYEVAVL
jgi:hypothetical protein